MWVFKLTGEEKNPIYHTMAAFDSCKCTKEQIVNEKRNTNNFLCFQVTSVVIFCCSLNEFWFTVTVVRGDLQQSEKQINSPFLNFIFECRWTLMVLFLFISCYCCTSWWLLSLPVHQATVAPTSPQSHNQIKGEQKDVLIVFLYKGWKKAKKQSSGSLTDNSWTVLHRIVSVWKQNSF